MLNIPTNELSEDIIIVKVYYFDIIKDLIKNGFFYNGEKYKYFTNSAGQIRTKKTVFIKESLWNKYEKTLMCGLTIDLINQKGGINVNKYLAYLALSNSATDPITDIYPNFDIRKTIIVDDFETLVGGVVDYIDIAKYSIERKYTDVPITHTDGCGMILSSVINKNFMIRLPWVKGLLASFDYVKFIEEANKNNPLIRHEIIKDIYNKYHNILTEDIQIIFTKSQFKMYKFYTDWNEYINNFIKYNCQAGYCNLEEDHIPNATINYQMIQTLNDMTKKEIIKLSDKSRNKINNITSSVSNMLEVFGVTNLNTEKNYLQQALEIYPELLTDIYLKEILKEIKNSMQKRYKAAKLNIDCKYTFLIPDLYAFCEFLFLGEKNPYGLLKNGEVTCQLYRKSDKLDCLRSPHLYKEHPVRKNIINDSTNKWFTTNAVYTSCHDLISKILQFDVDGDKSLVVADKLLINIAERNMVDIVPLYYEMKKADPVILNGESIYNGLNAAYTGGNIGSISNDITKIWNSGDITDEALMCVKYLCAENNFTIDYAKTLYKPTRPNNINTMIRQYTKSKVPYFFIFAKDKTLNQVEEKNDSVVNQLDKIIGNKKIKYPLKDFGKLDYKLLMNNPNIEIDHELIKTYTKLNQEYHYKINFDTKLNTNMDLIYNNIKVDLSKLHISDIDITDMLIKYLFHEKNSKSKALLWFCYGDIIVDNLKRNIDNKTNICPECGKRFCKNSNNQKYCESCQDSRSNNIKTIICIDCGKEVEVDIKNNSAQRCSDCYKKYRTNYYRLNKQKNRNK